MDNYMGFSNFRIVTRSYWSVVNVFSLGYKHATTRSGRLTATLSVIFVTAAHCSLPYILTDCRDSFTGSTYLQ